MNLVRFIAFAAAALMGAAVSAPAQAQQLQQIGVDGYGRPICQGPLGPGPCADIVAWMQRSGGQQLAPAPIPLPLTRDGNLTMQIAQACNGEPRCIAATWASVEVQRCAGGIGNVGGCFGPNGEIMRRAREHFNDITRGPGNTNDITGRDGWLRQRLGF